MGADTFRMGCLLLLLATEVAWPAAQVQNKVLMIGLDGTMPSALAVARTPTLNRLISEGAFSDRAITHPVTHSAACWSSMFTGVWGDKHGVNDPGNSFAGNQFDLYPSLMRSGDLRTWIPILPVRPGTGEPLDLTDRNPPAGRAFYRVHSSWQ